MKVGMLTREYPPEVYGGAGVHVTELTRFMREIVDVDVHCMGKPRDGERVFVHGVDPALEDANSALKTLSTGLRMAHATSGLDVVHSHTWYSGLGGHLSGLLHEVPHVATAHSLEPDRPWKREQLGGGYNVSSWSEKNAMEYADAVIAVSSGMKESILRAYPRIPEDKVHVVLNGVDTAKWFPGTTENGVLDELGVDTHAPMVAFVGRITRQKGVAHLLKAASLFDDGVQLILCAGAPDTPEIAEETKALVDDLRTRREGVFWVQDMLPGDKIREVYAAADVFVCPSIYEPLGIVNLEAMACGTAVVASRVGGIPEVVVDGETGTLVDYNEAEPEAFEHGIAEAVNAIIVHRDTAERMGRAGLERVRTHFTWERIARETVDIYQSLIEG
ncbi:Capsular glucan synthase [Corynebacterium capitovis DSM 44611]|uniref:glycogen synthase n=1 Tax=Corynebacterium capitovis TaxID=131081 RepID=UPI000684BA05|nr:glycogen synthase [Corynebacterium capitovis]WKD57878.1 Capsular glucan synthase [Corynebacterium capitovis DSM 44611]